MTQNLKEVLVLEVEANKNERKVVEDEEEVID